MYQKFQKPNKCTVILLSMILVFIGFYCFFNNWMYYFFDVGVKAISGIGAIFAGLFVYLKWQDEKNRSLYEKSLQEVYTPLVSELIKQEEYRQIVCPDILPKDAPVLSIKITTVHHHLKFTTDGLSMDKSSEEKPGILARENFLKSLKKESYSLASPALLTCINKYDLLLKLESESLQPILDTHPNFTHDKTVYDQVIKTPAGKKLELISHRRYLTELKLIHEIMTGYNNCIEKLGMYEERLEITVTSKK